MRKLVIALILVALGVGGYFGYQKVFVPPPEKPQVIQTTVSQGNIQEVVKATGSLQPLKTSPVGSQVSGVVKKLYVDFNSIVTQGQKIAEIDDSILQTQVDIQDANLQRQLGEIANQEVQLENDKTNLTRQEALFEKGLVNQQSIDASRLQVKTRTTQLEAAKKQLLTVEANLKQAKLNLSYATIYSPLDGVVVNRLVDEGQTVQSSLNVAQFFTLATDLRTLRLQAWVDEAEIGKIRKGQSVVFQVDTYMPERFSGTVEAVRLNAQNQSNVVTYPVWITVPNPELKLRPSMTATVDIVLSTASGVVRVPMSATRFRVTPDIRTALGVEAPAAGRGTALAGREGQGQGPEGQQGREGGQQGRGGQQQAEGGQQAPGGQPGRQAGGQGQGRTREGDQAAGGNTGRGGRGGRAGAGFGTGAVSPEDRERMAARFGGAGGRGGRGGRGGGGGAQPTNATTEPIKLAASGQIDEMWAEVPRPRQSLNVWTWDEPNKKLTQIPIVVGVSDGQFGELISGDLKPGQQLVTQVIIPISSAQRNQSIFGNQQRGGRGGGMQQGNQPGQGGQPRGGGGGGFGGDGGGGGGGGAPGGGGRGGVRF